MSLARRRIRSSISVPVTLAAITVTLSGALLVGWSVLLGQKISDSKDIAGEVWLLVLGAISFVTIMTVLVVFTVSLARGIIEVRKQDIFIDSITHELKSPLASIQLCLETLTREGVAPDQQERLRQMMLDDVARLRSFIDDVLVANRLSYSARGEPLNRQEINLQELIAHCAQNVSARHKTAEPQLQLNVENDVIAVTDAAALEIIVKNLIDNAIKYSEAPAHVEIDAHIDATRQLQIEVRDHGIGMESKDLKRVFQRFYRSDRAQVRARKGTGLGLFVVGALVREMRGTTTARSDGINKGTTIHVSIPDVSTT